MAVGDDLARFNAFLANEAEQEKQNRRIKRAEQAKEKAAAEVRRLDGDERASREDKDAAKQAYVDAHEAWRREVEGEGPEDPTPADADTVDGDADTGAGESGQGEGADEASEPVEGEPEAQADGADVPTESETPDETA